MPKFNQIRSLLAIVAVVLAGAVAVANVGDSYPVTSIFVSRDKAKADTDSLLRVLDTEIAGRSRYESDKRSRIVELHNTLRHAITAEDEGAALDALFEEYRNYNLDTALIVANSGKRVAIMRGDTHGSIVADLNRAEAYKGLADYHRALEVLDSIPRDALDIPLRRRYYSRYCSVYLSLYGQYSRGSEADHYRNRVHQYRDSIISLHLDSEWDYVLNRAENAKLDGDPEGALAMYVGYLESHSTDDIDMAVMAHLLGETYHQTGDDDLAVYYYLISAIMDVRSCTKKYMSLQELAFILNDRGDTQRAFNYINTTLNDVVAAGAHSRLEQVANILPVITDANNELTHREAVNRRWLYMSLALIGIILLVMLWLLNNRNRSINRQRIRLSEANDKLRQASDQLAELNSRLSELNDRLKESNHLKEIYIGDLFKLCSEYMDDMTKYRQSLRRLFKVGKTDEIAAALSKPVGAESFKEFLHRFDEIFLDIFPDFIDRFNELLEPSARITPPKGELLTPELRIYALVRLGINDSRSIAAFLNYSVQTVYNYRQRMRDHAIVSNKREFADRVARL